MQAETWTGLAARVPDLIGATEKVQVDDIMSVRETAGHLIDGFGRHRAYVQVQNGCDHRCTYCIVPYTRGVEISRSSESILREMNGANLTALDIQNMVNDRGANWVANDLARRDAGNANRASIYAREQGREMDSARTAQGFGQQAQQGYSQVAQQEAGKGGWGTRLLTGIAGAGLNMVAPGLGSVVTGALGGGGGGGAQPQAGYTPGSYGSPTASPYSIQWTTPPFMPYGGGQGSVNPQAAQTLRNLSYYSGGQTQPDGSFMVRR